MIFATLKAEGGNGDKDCTGAWLASPGFGHRPGLQRRGLPAAVHRLPPGTIARKHRGHLRRRRFDGHNPDHTCRLRPHRRAPQGHLPEQRRPCESPQSRHRGCPGRLPVLLRCRRLLQAKPSRRRRAGGRALRCRRRAAAVHALRQQDCHAHQRAVEPSAPFVPRGLLHLARQSRCDVLNVSHRAVEQASSHFICPRQRHPLSG